MNLRNIFKTLFLFLGIFAFMSFSSCSKDDEPGNYGSTDQNQNAGANNYTDIAVTGSASHITATSATLNGYINIDQAPIVDGQSKYDMGICISDKEDPRESDFKYIYTNIITGRSISVEVENLNPSTQYYYQAFFTTNVQGSEKIWKGEILSFKTKDFPNEATVDLVATSLHSALFYIDVDDDIYDNTPVGEVRQHWGVAVAESADQFNEEGRYKTYYDIGFYSANNLIADKEYFYCPFTKYGDVIRFGNVKSFRTVINNPYVKAWVDQESLSFTSIKILMSVSFPPADFVTDSKCRIEISESQDLSNAKTYQVKWTDILYEYQTEITDLEPGKTYYYRPYYTSDQNGIFYGNEIKSFTTPDSKDLVKTLSSNYKILETYDWDYIHTVYAIEATFNGALSQELMQNYDIKEYGFVLWSKTSNPDVWGDFMENYVQCDNLSNGNFSYTGSREFNHYSDFWLALPGQTYYYKAYCKVDGEGTLFGEEKSFTIK